MKPVITLSIGGSLMVPGEPDVAYIQKIANLLVKLSRKYKFAIVTGGGAASRVYARAMRKITPNEFLADQVAIMSTWQNAYLILAALHGKAYKTLPKTFDEAAQALETNDFVVMGGTLPGITTDTDTVLLAERVGSKRIVNISNVDAIYTGDPKKDKGAQKIRKMTADELVALAAVKDTRKAGENFVFDVLACKLLARSGIEAHFVTGRNIVDVERAICGMPHSGTVVR
ncbi:MAG: UMP kinase [Candidatus Micrarchaeota archaeon]|nr:UMP kinase [Candidatus Micrarchaeota archaeon]